MGESGSQSEVRDVADRLRAMTAPQLLVLAGLLAGELAAAKSAVVLEADKKEVRRRCRIMAARAEHGQYGKRVCPLCGKAIPSEHALAKHVERVHGDAVRDLHPSKFPA